MRIQPPQIHQHQDSCNRHIKNLDNSFGYPVSTHTDFDKEYANSQLRFGIRLLKGEGCDQTFERSLSDVISIRDRLNDMGAWWQAQRLDNWIHRAQKQGGYLLSAHRHEVPGSSCLQSPQRLTLKQSERGVS